MKLRIEEVPHPSNPDSYVGELIYDDIPNRKQYRTNIVVSSYEIDRTSTPQELLSLFTSRVNQALKTLDKGIQP